MYSLALLRTFTARHFLVGGGWGPENIPHSHQYRLEVKVSGPGLNAHGYLVDLVDLEKRMEEIVTSFRAGCLTICRRFRESIRASSTWPESSPGNFNREAPRRS